MEAKILCQVELRSIGVIQGDQEALDNIRELLLESALYMTNMTIFCGQEQDYKAVETFQGLHDKRIEDYDTISDLFNLESPRVMRGRWKGAGMGDYICSLCAEKVSGNRYNYCPNCGAKMAKEEP